MTRNWMLTLWVNRVVEYPLIVVQGGLDESTSRGI